MKKEKMKNVFAAALGSVALFPVVAAIVAFVKGKSAIKTESGLEDRR